MITALITSSETTDEQKVRPNATDRTPTISLLNSSTAARASERAIVDMIRACKTRFTMVQSCVSPRVPCACLCRGSLSSPFSRSKRRLLRGVGFLLTLGTSYSHSAAAMAYLKPEEVGVHVNFWHASDRQAHMKHLPIKRIFSFRSQTYQSIFSFCRS
jgi:hypothetical protein